MANIKNFGLVGVAADVQFGKAGPRLINDTNVFTFKNAAGSAAAPINAGVATVAGLTVGATGVISMGANKVTNVAAGVADTDAVNFKQLTDSTGSLQVEIDKVEASVGLDATGNLVPFAAGSAFGATSFKNAIEMVDAALAGEVTARQAAELIINTAITAETTRATNAETALSTQIQTAIAGITWKNPVNKMVADVTARDALTGLVAGDRIYVTADNKVYTYSGAAFNAGEVMVTGGAFFDKTTTVPYVYNGTSMVQFNGAAGLTGGLGLVLTGNNLDLDLAMDGGLRFYPDGTNPNNTVGLKLDGASLEVGSAGLKVGQATLDLISATSTAVTAEATRAGLAEAAIQSELDATQVGAGLSIAGAYVAETTSQYINSATSLKSADLLLDGAIKDVAAAVAALGSGSITALQTEVDFIEAAVGLDAAGKFVTFVDTNYLDAATSIVSSITALDVALKAVDVAYKAADLVLQGNIDAEVIRASAAEAQGLVDAKAYADGLNAAMVVYVDGKVTLLQAAIADAIDTAATDATAKADQALVDAKAYVDSKVATSVSHAARAAYVAFAATTDASTVDVGVIKGFVHRIKVYVTTAGVADVDVQVGVDAAHGQLVTTADVDTSTVGLYTLEVNQVYAVDTTVKVFVAAGTVAGTVVVEYL